VVVPFLGNRRGESNCNCSAVWPVWKAKNWCDELWNIAQVLLRLWKTALPTCRGQYARYSNPESTFHHRKN